MYQHPRFVSDVSMSTDTTIGEARLTDYLVEHPAVSMIHPMKGPSMLGLGIMDGDQLIVEKGRRPQEQDIVLAVVDDTYTIRQYGFFNGKPYLRSGNPDYGSIMPEKELVIQWVVTGMIRKYH